MGQQAIDCCICNDSDRQRLARLYNYNMGIDLQRSYIIRRQSEPIGSLMPSP